MSSDCPELGLLAIELSEAAIPDTPETSFGVFAKIEFSEYPNTKATIKRAANTYFFFILNSFSSIFSPLRHCKLNHHSCFQMLCNVAVKHPLPGICEIYKDVNCFSRRNQNSVLPCKISICLVILTQYKEPLAVQVNRMLHRVH